MAAILPASSHLSFKDLLAEAAERSGKYEWMGAAELHQRALDGLEPEHDPLETARVTELLATSYFKAAFQSESREEFKRVMILAEDSYEQASDLYEKAGSNAPSKRSKARSRFAKFWLLEDATGRRNIIGECISIVEEATQISGKEWDKRDFAEAQRDLLTYLRESLGLAREWKSLRERFERAVETGEKAARDFQALEDDAGVLDCLHLVLIIILNWFYLVLEPSEVGAIFAKAKNLVRRIVEVSNSIGTPYARSLANEAAGLATNVIDEDPSKALSLLRVAASEAKKTRDSLLTGRLQVDFWGPAEAIGWSEEDAEHRREVLEEMIERSSIAIKNLAVSFDGYNLGWTFDLCSQNYTLLATFVETEAEMKKAHLRKAIEIAREGYAYKDYSEAFSGYGLYKAMYFLSTIVVAPEEKESLLREALEIGEATVPFVDRLCLRSWVRGSVRNYLALVKAALSNIEKDASTKIQLLKSAVSDMEHCVSLVANWATYPTMISALAHYEEWYGDILLQLYQLTSERSTAQQAVQVYQKAIENLGKLGHVGSVAAVRWKLARAHDAIGDYKEASQAFVKAAEDYRLGAEKIPGSATVFGELASYMESWSLIEQARLHHGEEQYLLAAENYTKAANLLGPTKTGGHLSKHYMACSSLEGGEALSRKERPEASIESFNEAVSKFRATKADIETRLRESLGSLEKQELKTWHKVADGRERVCQGRIELEEAKILDRKGEEEASSAKYLSAAEIFKALLAEAESGQARKELETLVLLCEAWGKMKLAETRASPELYAEAADSFAKIEKTATRKRFHLMTLANASICKALESGTLFRRTRNTQLYSEIKKQLETATDYYQQAGLENAADWTRATGNLFDALVHLADAATERESRKKTEFYHLAEKHLQLAAKLYAQAGFPSRKEEALKHLERTRQEKEILLTPMEALAENPAVQGVAVAPVSLLMDQPLGLERFEAANVVGNLSVTQREVGVGSDVTLELEIANVGKTAATLIKLENIAPEGLELDRQKIPHRVEDNFIDMKGKRLEYLKTHEVKIPMKAVQRGGFELRPRILFVDEKGNYRSYDFEPVSLTVRELGISGWLKGR